MDFCNGLYSCCAWLAHLLKDRLFTDNLICFNSGNNNWSGIIFYKHVGLSTKNYKHFVSNFSLFHQVLTFSIMDKFKFLTYLNYQLLFQTLEERYLKHQMQHQMTDIVTTSTVATFHNYFS